MEKVIIKRRDGSTEEIEGKALVVTFEDISDYNIEVEFSFVGTKDNDKLSMREMLDYTREALEDGKDNHPVEGIVDISEYLGYGKSKEFNESEVEDRFTSEKKEVDNDCIDRIRFNSNDWDHIGRS